MHHSLFGVLLSELLKRFQAESIKMNILHHKSWHVRTKKNIEKVRRDEQRALEEQTEKARKADIAEQERRIQQLRSKFSVSQPDDQLHRNAKDDGQLHPNAKDDGQLHSKAKDDGQHLPVVQSSKQHINFFQPEYENTKNKAHALEKKIEQEAWEKKVGILRYLGGDQSSGKNELPWYEQLPTRLDNQAIGCKEASAIQRHDPLNKIKTELNRRRKDEEDLKKRKQLLLNRKERFDSKFNKFRDDRMKTSTNRKPNDRRSSERRRSESRTTSGSSGMRPEDGRLKGSQTTAGSQPDNRPDSELSEKELKLKLLREKRLKREQKEQKKSKDLVVTQSPFFCLDDRQRAYSNQFNPHLARR